MSTSPSLLTPSPFDAAVCIGRFQPLHSGHLTMLHAALAAAPVCVVVIGSAYQARTPKNPFTWAERAEMIRLALPEPDRARVRFLPMRDYYNASRWASAVRSGVAALVPHGSKVALVGHVKDASSGYLNDFPAWSLMPLPRHPAEDATHLRNALFASATTDAQAALTTLADQVPPSTLTFLQAWVQSATVTELAHEWHMLQAYRKAWASAPYPPVFVTVDAVVRCSGHVLLVRRGQAPGKGLLALPGGFLESWDTLFQSTLHELSEETQLAVAPERLCECLQNVTVFDHPQRSQRGRTITHAHYFDLGDIPLPEVRAGDDAAHALWVPIADLPALEDQFFDDHFHILDRFLLLI